MHRVTQALRLSRPLLPHSACCKKNNGVYEYLKSTLPIGPPSYTKNLRWNFEKFLVGRDGKTIGRYPTAKPAADLEPEIIKALAAPDPKEL